VITDELAQRTSQVKWVHFFN